VKIRTQLVIASFLLSILPLSAIVGYSYHSSREAVEAAYRREAGTLTRQMETRLASLRTDLERRLAEVSSLPLHDLGETTRTAVVSNVLAEMGDAASLVDSLEIQPFERPAPAAKPRPAPAAHATAPPVVARMEHPVPPPPPGESFVIDVPAPPVVARFTWTDDQKAQLKEITRLSVKLAGWNSMTPAEREQTQKELQAVQQTFDTSMRASHAEFEKQIQAAHVTREKAREERREAMLEQHDADEDAEPTSSTSVGAPAPGRASEAVAPAAKIPVTRIVRQLSTAERQQMRDGQKQASLLFGHRLDLPLRKQGEVVGKVSAQVSTEEVIKRVLGSAAERDEIAFAVDRDGNVYTRTPDDKKTLDSIGLLQRLHARKPVNDIPNWITAFNYDPQSGLRIGVARPVGDTFQELRKTAAKNFGYGMALVFVALIGIVPFANHITRDVKLVTAGAERIAHGDLQTRLPVKSRNEFGQLATAFNRMALDLSVQQQTIIEQERERKDYERKSIEMEEARRFQLSMLPKNVPVIDGYDVAVYTQTATEVGGDYYDFYAAPNGVLSVTIGDATGHGAKAGTMVTVIKTLFSGYAGAETPAAFLRDAAETVKRMDLGRMAMALVLARLENDRITIASAGMPPAYVHRVATGEVEEVIVAATPLGTLTADYTDRTLDLGPGDTVLFMTDGFPELLNEAGQQLGYVRAQQEFATAVSAPDANGVIAALAEAADRWHGHQPPDDDVTFVVVRAKRA
jgi:serine phosphatase RsbU (regulator of sigma subunit)